MGQEPFGGAGSLAIVAAYTAAVSLLTLLASRCARGCRSRLRQKRGEEGPSIRVAAPARPPARDPPRQPAVDPGDPCKLIFLVRTDVGMTKGKMCAQCGHAAVDAVLRSGPRHSAYLSAWRRSGQTKIAVKVNGEQLERSVAAAEAAGLPHGTIQDAGRTQVEPGTTTVGYIGPCPASAVDRITRQFPLL